MAINRSRLRLLQLATFATLAYASSAVAGTVGGTVDPINVLSNEAFTSSITIDPATGQTDTTIVTGRINNNNDAGWKLTVVSTNLGKLVRTEGGGGGGAGRQIAYTNVKFVNTGGTLGTGLSSPNNQSKNITTGASAGDVAGTTVFNTGAAVGTPGTATSATVDYDFALKISWSADRNLLSGTYQDTVTLTLANDN